MDLWPREDSGYIQMGTIALDMTELLAEIKDDV